MRPIGFVLALGFVAGCSAETGQSLQIVAAIPPNTTCAFDSTATVFRSIGSYDPRGYGTLAPYGYVLGMKVQNLLTTPVADPANTTGGRNVRNPANDIDVSGVEACWDLASNHAGPGAFDSGLAFDCGTLPADQRAFITSGTTVPADGSSVVVADVLQPAHLKAERIFGGDFEPRNLPADAIQPTNVLQPSFSLPLNETADAPNRSISWGNFPPDAYNTARVLVQVRAVGKTQTGIPVHSNWFTYPIDVTPGSLSLACEPKPTLTTCSKLVATLYIGSFVDVGGSCLPGFGGSINCVSVNTCPTPP